jgi:hypothetical protein
MVTLDEVRAEARQIDPAVAGRMLLTLLAGLLYAVGWVPAKTIRYSWVVLAWSFAAVKLGWRDGWSVQRSRA